MTYSEEKRLTAYRQPWDDFIGLWLSKTEWRDGVASSAFATGIEMEQCTRENEGLEIKPFLRLRGEEATALMDSLWEAGVRPSRDITSTGQLEAMRGHLEDMRALAFGEEAKPK